MILINIGNTHTCIAHTQDGQHFDREVRPTAWTPAQICADIASTWTARWHNEAIYLAGVVPAAQASWQAQLKGFQCPPWDPERFHTLIPNAYQPPQSLGFDRRCCLLAVAECAPHAPALVIDAGTAITLDLLVAGTFRGGQILPGLQMQLHALSAGTAQLPPLRPQPGALDTDPWGNSTVEAMQKGVWWQSVHALEGAMTTFLRAHPHGRVWLTGGDAPLLAPALPMAQQDPDLLLRGFYSLVTHSSEGIAAAEPLPK